METHNTHKGNYYLSPKVKTELTESLNKQTNQQRKKERKKEKEA